MHIVTVSIHTFFRTKKRKFDSYVLEVNMLLAYARTTPQRGSEKPSVSKHAKTANLDKGMRSRKAGDDQEKEPA